MNSSLQTKFYVASGLPTLKQGQKCLVLALRDDQEDSFDIVPLGVNN
jgi:hypothetical protein